MSDSFEKTINQVKKSMQVHPDVAHVVRVFTCNDQFVCEACRKLEGSHYNEDIFKLPDPNDVCSRELGCRCWFSWSTAIGHELPERTEEKKPSKRKPWWKR